MQLRLVIISHFQRLMESCTSIDMTQLFKYTTRNNTGGDTLTNPISVGHNSNSAETGKVVGKVAAHGSDEASRVLDTYSCDEGVDEGRGEGALQENEVLRASTEGQLRAQEG